MQRVHKSSLPSPAEYQSVKMSQHAKLQPCNPKVEKKDIYTPYVHRSELLKYRDEMACQHPTLIIDFDCSIPDCRQDLCSHSGYNCC